MSGCRAPANEGERLRITFCCMLERIYPVTASAPLQETDNSRRRALALVFAAGLLWSTVGLGIRLIEDASVWQILLYRSFGLTALLYIVIRWRTGKDPFVLVRRAGIAGVIAALSLVSAYTGAIYSMQTTSVANAMLLFAVSPFLAAVLGWLFLRERVRNSTWVAVMARLRVMRPGEVTSVGASVIIARTQKADDDAEQALRIARTHKADDDAEHKRCVLCGGSATSQAP